MKVSPAFQFYYSDFINGTNDMTAEEVGGYIRLLCYQWDRGFVPDDDRKITAITRCQPDAVASIRLKFGLCQDGALRNPRLEQVREAQIEFRKKQSTNGRKRWLKGKKHAKPHASANANGIATSEPEGSQTDALYTPVSSKEDTESTREKNSRIKSEAIAIYQLYPRKVGKPDAIKALSAALNSVDAATITASLQIWIDYWRDEGTETQFIPFPATWTRREPWNDPPPKRKFSEEPPRVVLPSTDEVAELDREEQDAMAARREWFQSRMTLGEEDAYAQG